jgi:hypothetical protein
MRLPPPGPPPGPPFFQPRPILAQAARAPARASSSLTEDSVTIVAHAIMIVDAVTKPRSRRLRMPPEQPRPILAASRAAGRPWSLSGMPGPAASWNTADVCWRLRWEEAAGGHCDRRRSESSPGRLVSGPTL